MPKNQVVLILIVTCQQLPVAKVMGCGFGGGFPQNGCDMVAWLVSKQGCSGFECFFSSIISVINGTIYVKWRKFKLSGVLLNLHNHVLSHGHGKISGKHF